MIIGLAVLGNYGLHEVPLWRPTAIGMTAHPWTALCFVAVGAGAWSSRLARLKRIVYVPAAFVAGVVAFRIATIATGSDAFSTVAPFRERLAAEALAGHRISMSPQSIIMLLLIVSALIFLLRRQTSASQAAAASAALLALASHIGLTSGAAGFFGQMALPTMLGGLLASLAIVTQTAHRAPLRHILRRKGVGRRARHQIVILTGSFLAIAVFRLMSGAQFATKAEPLLAATLVGIVLLVLVTDARDSVRSGRYRTEPAPRARSPLQGDLRGAAARGEIFLLYQPQFDLTTHRISGVEAVARWSHPIQGLIWPVDFIPVAEQSGIIVSLGIWILRSACTEAARWQTRTGLPGVRLSVNVSPVQLKQPRFVAGVLEVLRETGWPPDRLVLEVTENVMVAEGDPSLQALRELNEAGVGIAIDDFGTGYSSLSYLQRLPSDHIKLDRSFVTALPDDGSAAAIARAVVAMGQSLGKRTIAEGIESEEQADFLRDIGCHEGQGYWYARPLPAADVLALIVGGGTIAAARAARQDAETPPGNA